MSVLQTLVSASVIAALAYLAAIASVAVFSALRAGGRREEGPDTHDALASSRLTMPVSIVVPAGSSSRTSRALSCVVDSAYPEFEVIVVADAGTTVLQEMVDDWQLEAREFFYRRAIEGAPVRRIFRSLRDPRVMVVESEPGRRSDALNCGINFARYRFVAIVPPTVSFERTALLSAMSPALRDPLSIVGVGSPVERLPEEPAAGSHARFQRLRSIRSLMLTRLFWARLRRGLGAEDSVTIWRRDAVLQANGFSGDVADPELDMMFRLQRNGYEERRFVTNEDTFGHTATLPRAAARIAARQRQRSALQATGTWGLGAGPSIGLRAFTYFLETELITPLAQLWIVLATVAGAGLGWYSWLAPIGALTLLSFGTAAVTAAALLVRGAYAHAPDGVELRRLLMLAPLEFLLHRPVRARARIAAVLGGTPIG